MIGRFSYARIGAVVVLGSVLAAATCEGAGFKADVTTTGRGTTGKGKVFVSGRNVRYEGSLGGASSITIVRADKGLTWVINPGSKTYMEFKGEGSRFPYGPDLKKHGTVKKLGTEKIAGYVCDKTLVTPKVKNLPPTTVWFSEKLQFPLKTESRSKQGTFTWALKNVKEGPQPAGLFELTKGLKKVSMPGSGPRPGPPMGPGKGKRPG